MVKKYLSDWINKIKLKIKSLKKEKPKTGYETIDNHLGNRRYWKFDRKSVSIGVGIGVFCAWIPLPMQMLLATFLCLIFKGNIACGILFTWVSNPITMVPFVTLAFYVGNIFSFIDEQNQVIKFFIGSMICGIISSVLIGISTYFFWHMIRSRGKNNVTS